MGAYEEIRANGVGGDLTAELLRKLASQVVRMASFPPPEGHDGWNSEAIDDLLANMLSQPGDGAKFILNCYLKAIDEPSLERLFLATIGNYLKDEAKSTPRGKLRRRLTGLMESDPRFVRVPASVSGTPSWALQGGPTRLWQGDLITLEKAAWAVRGASISSWNTSGPTSIATRTALLAIAHAVLTEAAGSVRDEDIARIVQGRFALLKPPLFTSLDADDFWLDPPAPTSDGPAEQIESVRRAEEIWACLSQTERSLLPHLGKPPREIAEVLEIGPKRAAVLEKALREKLKLATVDDHEKEDVVKYLFGLCQNRP